MNNYEYIVSSLPILSRNFDFSNCSPESILDEIQAQCSDKDKTLIAFLLRGFDAESLCEDFYREALTHSNRFIREYFAFDLQVRNAKVRYLNTQLERPTGKDILDINADEDAPVVEIGEFEEEKELESILSGEDLLIREKGLDDLSWKKVDEITTFNYFDIEAILGFICKLQTTARWFRLDEATGREMFRKLVEEIRGTFQGVKYEV